MDKAVITTAFPKTKSVAKRLGVSHARTAKLSSLMDKIAANGHTYRVTFVGKKRVAKKKKK